MCNILETGSDENNFIVRIEWEELSGFLDDFYFDDLRLDKCPSRIHIVDHEKELMLIMYIKSQSDPISIYFNFSTFSIPFFSHFKCVNNSFQLILISLNLLIPPKSHIASLAANLRINFVSL
jgi:hypothetical protein